MPPLTTAQRRAHYDDFVTDIIDLCAVNGVRAALASGRGRPVEHCARMRSYLVARIGPFGARRAHYTIASLIAEQRDLHRQHGPYRPETALPHSASTAGDALRTDTPDGLETGASDDAAADADESTSSPGQDTNGRAWRARPNLGTSLALAVTRHGFKQNRMDEQMKILIRLPTSLLHPRLWTLASHLNSRGAARLDFAVLLADLAWWDDNRLHIATRWHEQYFQTLDLLDHQEN
ncbi:type I-E CRISPR-associated protein Cse2/CasB [Streptomyces sp. NPDC020951]|uniref:type I-E CRISPR-associated protein Cse2/CasB n=1 Tax=Streptomyces sp. NPDC020951 TaxID=3365104 RepID=UPI0037BDB3D2